MQLATSQAGKGNAASRFSIVIQARSHVINGAFGVVGVIAPSPSTAHIQVFVKLRITSGPPLLFGNNLESAKS
jgi:hypothetical protein